MTEQEKDQVAEQGGPEQASLFPDEDSIAETEEQEQKPLAAVDLRKASYFVLTLAAIFVINAMETVGDCYGVYGFSSYGRENVELLVIKGIEEKFSSKVGRRIDR